jgi:hypothetical protein
MNLGGIEEQAMIGHSSLNQDNLSGGEEAGGLYEPVVRVSWIMNASVNFSIQLTVALL